jgi:glycine cleavage system H lipoate-binding protein/formate hydrogenlyase subunit 6/NADH:ubiquinone oxidoreductase subunit I
MCIVEVKKGKRMRLVTSCNFPASEGLEVRTDTEEVIRNRRLMAELLLARCPEVKQVREMASALGVEKSRFKIVDEPSECVMCGLCVRICDQYVGASALGFIGRGNQRVVGTPWSVDTDACIACGACTYVCPTGVMQMEALTTERWRRELASDRRLCRYARMGLISYKICPNDFRCAECDVDQRLFEELGTHPLLAIAPGLRRLPKQVGPFDIVEDRYYSRGHSWIKFLNDRVRMGMDDFAQKLFGTIQQVKLHAKPGDAVKLGKPALTVYSDGRAITLRFPISGAVTYINRAVKEDPSLLNDDCYDRGWIYQIEPSDFYIQARRLVDRDEAESWLKEQSAVLARILEAKGIDVSSPGFAGKIKDEDFTRLDKEFFKGEAVSEK